ncbi:unnamed protein product [Paramecium sonneborni]|uniref:Uncharacterized protein n=1 Tax=Paramecium sonneborni TaxID=65129 RepID=A0A8S1K850_9CILI|nr:unnamed protein product [Paramecium sonneborni]
MSEQEDLFDFDNQPNWNSYEFDIDNQEMENQQLKRIKEQCNVKLLKRQLVCLFGFPTIQVDSCQIFSYLNEIMDLNENEQKRRIRVLISFIGEVTSIEDHDTRLLTLRSRVEQFLTIKGVKIEWNNKEWEQEIESLFESRYCNPYYSKIPYTQFQYTNFFALLESPMPMFLRSVQHPCFCQVYDAKSTDDFKQLCNITDLKNVRRIRKYIQSIIDKLEEFRNLIILIDSRDYNNSTDVINIFNQLSGELDKIINIDLQLSDKYSPKQEGKLKLQNDVDNQTEKNSIAFIETKTSANTFTTIHQGSLDCRTKKQKKKQKILEKCQIPSTFLNYLDSETNLSQENSSNFEPKCDDLLFQLNIFGLDPDFHKYLNNESKSIEDIQKKIEIYEKQLQILEQIGFPSPQIDQARQKYILQNFSEFYSNKKTLIEQILCSIWESLVIKNNEVDYVDGVRKQALQLFSSINLTIDKEEFEIILNNCYEKQASISSNNNFESTQFSLNKLSKIVNRQFPESFTLKNCLTSRSVFKAKSIQPLQQQFNIQEIKNIRFIRNYIKDLLLNLEKLVQFKNKLVKTKNNKNQDQLFIREFNKLEQIHQKDVVNRKLRQQYQKIEKPETDEKFILIDEKEQLDQLDQYFDCNNKKYQNEIEIEDDIIFIDEDSVKLEQDNQSISVQKQQKNIVEVNLKLEAPTGVEQVQQKQQPKQQQKQQLLCEDLISPVQRNYFHEYQSPNFFNSPCFNYCSPLANQQIFFCHPEFDQQEIESPGRQIQQFQSHHNFN